MSIFLNVMSQAVRPGRFKVMVKKIFRRLESDRLDENLRWLEERAISFEDAFGKISPELWQESLAAAEEIDRKARARLETLPVALGGGGATPYLYYLTRLTNPDVVVETGVAAGYSSQAILAALEKSNRGRLYSSDFPYFRIANPESYIGCIVDESLRPRWTLFVDGDESNLRKILSTVDKIDLFHYDSDKSYAGRKSAMDRIRPYLSADALILMDDIQDNAYFKDLVGEMDAGNWHVFRYSGKFVGMIGVLRSSELRS